MLHYNEVVIDTPGPYLGFLQSRMPNNKLLRIDFLPQCTTKIPGLTDRHGFPEKVYCLFTVMIKWKIHLRILSNSNVGSVFLT